MSVLLKSIHDKYVLDIDEVNKDLVVYEYNPATFSKSEGEYQYSYVETYRFSGTPGLTAGPIFGSWYDTTSQYTTANTATKMYCDTTAEQNGIIKKFGSNFEVQYDGKYNLQFSVQLDQASGAGEHIYIWFRKNGVDIPYSASEVALQGTTAESIPSWNFIFDLQAGDYVNVMYSVTDANVHLKAVGPVSPVPAIPSVIITMWRL
jgi:hypothetical protein